MATRVGALVVSTSRAAEVVEFYRTLGLPLVEEDHGDGAQHWACDVDDIHLAVLATDGAGDAPSYHEPGSTFCGFVVDDVSALTERLRRVGVTVVQEPNRMPWGLRAVVLDPDRRPIEILDHER
jgi:catechol 2,3-dioxygenase-like lactoylglutathione lyase family enzyme